MHTKFDIPSIGPVCSSICQYVTADVLGNNVLGLFWSMGLSLRCTVDLKQKSKLGLKLKKQTT